MIYNKTDQSVGFIMQSRSEETRNLIKASAVSMFCQNGYDAASVGDICSQAGVSKGAFYHHFPSKQALFLSIMQDWLDGIDLQLFSKQNSNKSIPELIKEMGNTMGVIFRAASGQLPMFMEFMVQASRDEDVWRAVIAPYRTYQQSFAGLIEMGKQEGSINPDVDANQAALVLMSLAIGILLQGVVDSSAADWEGVTNSGVEMILDSISRRDK